MIRKTILSEKELRELFDIIKPNMEELGFAVTETDYETWSGSLKSMLPNPNHYFYVLMQDSRYVGFVSLIRTNDILTLSEIQFNNSIKQTKAILKVLRYLYICEEFKSDDCVHFSILKNNSISNQTFTHLGGELIGETEKKYKYKLSRNNMGKYLSKFAK